MPLTRREFLQAAGIYGVGSLITSCGPRPTVPETQPPTPQEVNIIQLGDEIPPIKEGEGPPGKLIFFTDPAVKFGTHNLEYHPELIMEGAVYYLCNTDGSNLEGGPASLISSPVWSPDEKFFVVHLYDWTEYGDWGALWFYNDEGNFCSRTDTPLSPAELAWSSDGESLFYTGRFYRVRRLDNIPPDTDLWQSLNPDRCPNWINGVCRFIAAENRHEVIIRGNSGELYHNPSPSPDGTKVAFTRHTHAKDYEVMIASLLREDSPQPRTACNAITLPITIDSGTSLLINPNTGIQWTPDGQKLLYMMDHGIMLSDGSIMHYDGNILHIVDLSLPRSDPSRSKQIMLPGPSYVQMPPFTLTDEQGTRQTANNFYVLDNLDLAPDGSKIAFGSQGKITVMDTEGNTQFIFALPAALESMPDDVRWIPQDQICFTCNNEYFILNPTARTLRKVLFPEGMVTDEGLRYVISSA